jgi:hypothetical protein
VDFGRELSHVLTLGWHHIAVSVSHCPAHIADTRFSPHFQHKPLLCERSGHCFTPHACFHMAQFMLGASL